MRKANSEWISSDRAKRDLLREWHQNSSSDNINEPASSIEIQTVDDSQRIPIRIREFIRAELELYFGKG